MKKCPLSRVVSPAYALSSDLSELSELSDNRGTPPRSMCRSYLTFRLQKIIPFLIPGIKYFLRHAAVQGGFYGKYARQGHPQTRFQIAGRLGPAVQQSFFELVHQIGIGSAVSEVRLGIFLRPFL